MSATQAVKENNYFDVVLSISEMNPATINEAKEIFDRLVVQRIILPGVEKEATFDDNQWQTSDEYSHVGFHFNFNQFTYNRFYESLFNITFVDFVDYVKSFIIFTFGKRVLKSMQIFLNDLKRLIRTDPEEIFSMNSALKISEPSLCIDFITMIPSTNDEKMEELADVLETYIDKNRATSSKQRDLAQFDSYFLFNDIINDFWEHEEDSHTRLFYTPLYMWWTISGVLPMRPREFILMDRNCLYKKDSEYFLTVRKNNLKGDNKPVSYKISEDYYDFTVKIPEKLGVDIEKYIEATSDFRGTDIGTLFITDPHYEKWGQKKHSNSRYLTYINLNTILRYFYSEIIEGRYHLSVVYNDVGGHLSENTIQYIHLGDTRHISMINIVAEGGSPVIAMMLAGHSDVNTSAHYFSNITNLIECRTYREYREVMQNNVEYKISSLRNLPERKNYISLSDGGRCYSDAMLKGEYSDCLSSIGKMGEIGACLDCSYYRKKGHGFFIGDNKYKQDIKLKCKELAHIVELARSDKGSVAEIGECMMHLQSSVYSYEQYLKEKHMNEGEKWEEENS